MFCGAQQRTPSHVVSRVCGARADNAIGDAGVESLARALMRSSVATVSFGGARRAGVSLHLHSRGLVRRERNRRRRRDISGALN